MKCSSAAAIALLFGCTPSDASTFGLSLERPRSLSLSSFFSSNFHRSSHAVLAKRGKTGAVALFGDTECPCIGFDNIDGETTVLFEDDTKAAYPADLGARCESWDNGRHPSCREGETPGIGNDWCGQQWCFVDACNCNIPVMPTPSEYVPDARYRGKPLFFSYATCGGKDMWTKERPKVGTPGCRCIGFDDVPGTTEVTIKGKGNSMGEVVEYPAEIGGTCQTWDMDVHPECKQGKDSPKWCFQRWCYVDPCSCDMKEPPKVTMYLPEATFTGKSLYYSYATCQSKDYFTKNYNLDACVNQDTKEDCLDLKLKSGNSKCAWTGSKCLGWELVEHPLCKKVAKDAGIGKDKPEKDSAFERQRPAAMAFALSAFLLGRFF